MAQPAVTIPKPRITAATRRRINLRRQLWPEVSDSELWNRARFTGFTTIPRTLSVVMRAIDALDKKSAARVYFDLWCRSFDDYVIEIKDEYECAFASGYDGQRAVRSWRERISVIESLGFVRTHKAPHGAYRFILLLDPHAVVEQLYNHKRVDEETWITLQSLLISIGQLTRR